VSFFPSSPTKSYTGPSILEGLSTNHFEETGRGETSTFLFGLEYFLLSSRLFFFLLTLVVFCTTSMIISGTSTWKLHAHPQTVLQNALISLLIYLYLYIPKTGVRDDLSFHSFFKECLSNSINLLPLYC
jgi:hypothetical protein